MNLITYKTFAWLLWKDIRVLYQDLANNVLDAVLLPVGVTFVNGYILPALGMPKDFGIFASLGTVIGMLMNSCSTFSNDLVMDLDADKSIFYEISLPLPYYLVYVKYALAYSIKAMLVNILILPISVLIMFGTVNFTEVSLLKLLISFLSSSLFFGFFCLMVAIYIKDIVDLNRFWIRWGWQLFYVAGCFFSWMIMYKAVPFFALINLANPIVYNIEALRAAFFGQAGYLPFWLCIAVIWIFTIVFTYFGLRKFKTRLDCI
jgi:ABC-2 type transport system permease protein